MLRNQAWSFDGIQKLPATASWCYHAGNVEMLLMYATMEADIRKGRIVPLEPEKVPKSGRVLLVMMEQAARAPQWMDVRKRLGWLRMRRDPCRWQEQIRDEWRENA